jgi:alcohol dehydrogenase
LYRKGAIVLKKEYSAVVENVNEISIKEFTIPQIGPDDGLLKVEMAGVCGSDPKIYHGKFGMVEYPLILGHEILGHIEEIGDNLSNRYKVVKGDRVIMEAFAGCGRCEYCLQGLYKFCEHGIGYGIFISSKVPPHLWGAYGEYMYIAPRSVLHKISENILPEAAVLAGAVISNGVAWTRILGEVSIGQTVVIQGVGCQGLASTIVAKESGASPIIVIGKSIDKDRFDLARKFGADYTIDVDKGDVVHKVKEITDGKMADLIIEVTGSPQAVAIDLDLAKKRGTIINAGITGLEKVTPLLVDKIMFKEIRFQGAFSSDYKAYVQAVKIVESKKYPIEKMVTHKYPLDEAEKALKAVAGEIFEEYPIKAVILPR